MRRWQGMGFAGFCLLAGSRWLVENAWPSSLPSLLGQAFRFGVVGLVGLVFCLLKRQRLGAGWWRIGLAGVLLFTAPALAGEWVGSESGPALFTLVPLCVVVAAASMSAEQGSRRLMMPALAGAAGGLLVLPFALPASLAGAAMMGVMLLAVGMVAVASVWLHALLRGVGSATGVWLVCLANAVVLGAAELSSLGAGLSSGGWLGELARATFFDLPEVFLLLWLVREVRPEEVAARYLFVPLVTVAEGLVLMRPGLGGRMVLGLVLMLVGGSALLFWKDDGAEDARFRLLG